MSSLAPNDVKTRQQPKVGKNSQNHILEGALEHRENLPQKVRFEPFLDLPCGGVHKARLEAVNYEHPGLILSQCGPNMM